MIPSLFATGNVEERVFVQFNRWLILENLLRQDTKTLLPFRTLSESVSD